MGFKDKKKSKDKAKGQSSSSGGTSGTQSKKIDLRFTPLDHRNSYAQASFEVVKELVVLKVKKDFDDGGPAATCLDKETIGVMPVPVREHSQLDPKASKQAFDDQEEGFKFSFQDAMKTRNRRIDVRSANLLKAYALIWDDYMTKAMQDMIEGHPDFKTSIEDKPIALLKAIRVSMQKTTRVQLPMWTAMLALIKFVNYRQPDGLSLGEYVKYFKEQRDVFVAQAGSHMWDGLAELLPGYAALGATEKVKFKADCWNQFEAILLLYRANHKIFTSLSDELHGAYTRGRDEFPVTIKAAHDMLDTHFQKSGPRSSSKDQPSKPDKDHSLADKTNGKSDKSSRPQTSFNQGKAGPLCFVCGATDHKVPECKWKDKIARNDWYDNNGKKVPKEVTKSFSQASKSKSKTTKDETDDESVASNASSKSEESD